MIAIPILTLNAYRFVNGFKYWRQCRVIYQEYLTDIHKLQTRRDKLEKYVNQLTYDDLTQERIARKYGGYIKQGETAYRIIP